LKKPDAHKEPAAEWVQISALKPWDRNPRKNEAAIKKVAESIRRFGFASPILARRADGELIAGHTRLAAAKLLGIDQVPVRYLDLDPADAHLLALADNKLGEIAEWDDAQLLELLGDLRQQGTDAALVAGWSDAEIDGLLEGAGNDVLGGGEEPGAAVPAPVPEVTEDEVPIDRAEELREKWQTAPGQLWEIAGKGGTHRILCGDSTSEEDFDRLMGGRRAVLLHTDPPYGVSVAGGTKNPRDARNFRSGSVIQNDSLDDDALAGLLCSVLANCRRCLVDGSAFYVWHPSSRRELFAAAVRSELAPYRQIIVWHKKNFVFGRQDYHWQHEPCLYGWVPGAAHTWLGSRDQSTVWATPPVGADLEKKIHPTAKPIALPARAISNHTRQGDVVLEPFAGSGSTVVAAEQLGRVCYAMELEPKYVAVALERLAALGLEPKLCPAPPTS
jgi:site-specific DNA-methyltransferase (adenine-specific)